MDDHDHFSCGHSNQIFIIIFFFNFRSDSNAPASVQIEATEESEQGFDGMIYFYLFLLLDLIQLLSISNLINQKM